jgi:hypothetical protein
MEISQPKKSFARRVQGAVLRCLAVLLVTLVVMLVLLMGSLEQEFLLDPWIDTRLAPGFSEDAFQQIELGMTGDEVQAILGEPLEIGYWGEGSIEEWYYTQDGACWFWDFAWKCRSVKVCGNRVGEVKSATHYD